MDGRGRCRDNAKMERFWWALKYEDIKIKDYVSLPQLRSGIQHYVNFYNTQRVHSALQYKTPDKVYLGTCNSVNRGYINSRSFPIFWKKVVQPKGVSAIKVENFVLCDKKMRSSSVLYDKTAGEISSSEK